MKQVMLVVWGFEPFGGMEQHVLQLAIALKGSGVGVTVFSEMPVAYTNAYARAFRASGIMLCAPSRLTWILNGLQIALQRTQAGKDRLIHGGGVLSASLRWSLDRIGRGLGADLIHIHGCRLGQTWLIDWARRRKLASVYTEHVAITELGGPLTSDGPRLAMAAGVLACVSDHSRDSLASLLPSPRKIAITGHVVPHVLRPCERKPKPPSMTTAILCPARLASHKGIDVLLHALVAMKARCPRVRLTLAGGGAQEAEFRQLALDLGVAGMVDFAGALSPEQMAKALARTDIVVLPSRSEGLPLALLEAMAAGKPVVASRVGGIPELLRSGENGLLVEAEDATGLADALATLATDPALRQRLGDAAWRTFEDSAHHADRVIPRMLALYRQARAA